MSEIEFLENKIKILQEIVKDFTTITHTNEILIAKLERVIKVKQGEIERLDSYIDEYLEEVEDTEL